VLSYNADLAPISDSREPAHLKRYDLNAALLADPALRIKMLNGQSVPTQDFSRRLIADGFAGLLIRSFTKGAAATDLNIVL